MMKRRVRIDCTSISAYGFSPRILDEMRRIHGSELSNEKSNAGTLLKYACQSIVSAPSVHRGDHVINSEKCVGNEPPFLQTLTSR